MFKNRLFYCVAFTLVAYYVVSLFYNCCERFDTVWSFHKTVFRLQFKNYKQLEQPNVYQRLEVVMTDKHKNN